ncbi:major capsid protein [Biston robustus cypovirus]|nr:major capsid protein [Biston robustus cypovirus]
MSKRIPVNGQAIETEGTNAVPEGTNAVPESTDNDKSRETATASTEENGDDKKSKTSAAEPSVAQINESLLGIVDGAETPNVKVKTPHIRREIILKSADKRQYGAFKDINEFSKFYSSIQGIKAIKLELTSFRKVEKRKAYVEYLKVVASNYDSTQRSNPLVKDYLFSETENMFEYGTRYIRQQISKQVQEICGLIDDGEVRIKQSLREADFTNTPPVAINDYMHGRLMIIMLCILDNEIESVGIMEKSVIYSTVDTIVEKIIRSQQRVRPQKPNIAALMLNETDANWLKNDLITQFIRAGDSLYKLGRSSAITGQLTSGKMSEKFYQNDDMITTAIQNVNMHFLQHNENQTEQLTLELEAHAYANTTVTASTNNETLLQDIPQPDHQLRVLLTSCILIPGIVNAIHANNVAIVDQAASMRISQTDMSEPESIKSSDQHALIQDILARWYELASVSDIAYYMSREIAPLTSVLFMRQTKLIFDDITSIFHIAVLIIFSILFPRHAACIKGEMSNILHQFLETWLPEEHARFIATYGRTYTMVGRQRQFGGATRAWNQQDDALSNKHPSLFAGIVFEGCRNITALMSLFLPIGQLVRDTRAINASYPRLSLEPAHYIPIQPMHDDVVNPIKSRATLAQSTLMTILRLRADKVKPRTATTAVVHDFITHMFTMLASKALLFGNHHAWIYNLLANLPHNFMNNYDGRLAEFKPTQYVLADDANVVPRVLLSQIRNMNNETSMVNPYIILAMIFRLDGPVLSAAGQGTDPVETAEKIVQIDCVEALKLSRRLMNTLDAQLKPLAMMTLLNGTADGIECQEWYYQGVVSGIIRIITFVNYERRIQNNADGIFVVDDDTTPEEVGGALGAGRKAFLLNDMPDENVRNAFFGDEGVILILGYNVDDAAELLSTDIVNVEYRMKLSFVTLSMLTGRGDYDRLRMLAVELKNQLPEYRTPHIKHFMDELAKLTKVETPEYGKRLLENEISIQEDLVLFNPKLRRGDNMGTPLEFDDNVDHPAIEHTNDFLTDVERERAIIGCTLVLNNKFKVMQGLIISKTEASTFTPDETAYIPDGLETITYNRMIPMFRVQQTHASPNLSFENNAGVHVTNGEFWKRIILIINDTTSLRIDDRNGILKGINEAKWIVKLPNVYFVPHVSAVSKNPTPIRKLLESQLREVHAIEMLDTTNYSGANVDQRVEVSSYIKTIFPMENIMYKYSARNLSEIHRERPENSIIPDQRESLTGYMDEMGQLRYPDHTLKLQDEPISMSNEIHLVSKNMQFDADISFEIDEPKSIYHIDF